MSAPVLGNEATLKDKMLVCRLRLRKRTSWLGLRVLGESRASLRLKENRVVPGCQETSHNATYPFLRFSTYLLTMSLQIVDIVLVRKHEQLDGKHGVDLSANLSGLLSGNNLSEFQGGGSWVTICPNSERCIS